MRIFQIALFFILASGSLVAQIKPEIQENARKATSHYQPGDILPIQPLRPAAPAGRIFDLPAGQPRPLPPLTRLQLKQKNIEIERDVVSGRVVAVRGELPMENVQLPGKTPMENRCFSHLLPLREILGVQNPAAAFEISRVQENGDGFTHVRLQQMHQGVKIHGAELLLHFKGEQAYLLNGRWYATPALENLQPALSSENAMRKAWDDVAGTTIVRPPSQEQALWAGAPESIELVIWFDDEKKPHLAWSLEIVPNLTARWAYVIDAQTGEVLRKFSQLCQLHGKICEATHQIKPEITTPAPETPALLTPPPPATATATDLLGITRTINTYLHSGTYYLIDASRSMFNAGQSVFPDNPVGTIWTINALNTSPENNNFNANHVTSGNNTWNNASSVSAHYNAGKAFEYFKNTFNRNSINGQGGNIVSFINVADGDGSSMGNAFWNGAAMFYGNGDQAFSSPLARSLDVAGHEMSHGVIQNTANLEYYGESGAMNESFADVFGAMIDRDDWKLGEDVVNTNVFPTGALRDLSNPNNGGNSLNDPGWQPDHMSEKYNGSADNNGVHINSGITNRAFFLFATAVTKNVAEQIYYRALTTYLGRSSQFIDLRIAIIQAATDLHGANSAQVTAAANAFTTVGIGNGQGGDYEQDYDPNPGDEYIVYTNTNQSKLSLANSTGAIDTDPLVTVGPFSKPTVTDDGTAIVYVAQNKTLRAIIIDWFSGTFQIQVLSNQPIWRNAAISKDGNRLAALTDAYDNILYVYDLVNGTNEEYALYNPTYAEGINTGDVVYPDVIEWDFSGENVLYDALNEINTNNQAIEYWDIGFVRVWNNALENFGDGFVSKLFSGLPENTSVANPTFSKNSPYIIAFDYIDEFNDENFVLGVNYESGDVSDIYENTILGYPNYSTDDNFLIFDALTTNDDDVVAIIPLAADKISPAGDASIFISDNTGSKWGVWFANGLRDISASESITPNHFRLQAMPNPFAEDLTIGFELPESADVSVAVFDLTGRMVGAKNWQAPAGRSTQGLALAGVPSGIYSVRMQANGQQAAIRVVKM
ncbi:MAG: M4 family metallopeptidase [Saprospiraceae bacterium]|nr:M4 family metallopeptidase [Saprospiraceae bacterium]